MPAINPNNYNIDFFQSYSFGDITDTSYLTYLFSQNLPDLPQELIDGAAGNFLSKYGEKGLEKSINYGPITNPGNLDEWLLEGNFPVDLNDIRTQTILGKNEYGPQTIQAYNCPNLEEPEETGFIQYQTSVGGNVVTNLLGETLDAVGLGGLNAFLIDFPSELNEIANERRLAELKSRIKENLINETVGRVNLDPIGLLSGQPLFGKDYKITKPAKGIPIPGLGVLTDLADINLLALRGDPLPDGAFDWDQPVSDPFSPSTIDISKALLKHTGKGTQGLLFKSLAPNKYGPRLESKSDTRQLATQAKKEDEPKEKLGYLAFANSPKFKQEKEDEKREKQDKKQYEKSAKQLANKGATILPEVSVKANYGRSSRPDVPITPTESDDPSVQSLTTNEKLKFQGFEFENYGLEIETDISREHSKEDQGHLFDWDPVISTSRITPNISESSSFDGTWTKNDGTLVPGSNEGHEPGAQVWTNDLYWKDGREYDLPKRGLLNYTQKLINKSTNVAGTPARFIGMPNSNQNYDAESGDRRHIEMSQGNLVKETKENKYYCRSWSVRNAYNRYHDLIRHDELWRNTQPGTIRDGKSDPNTKLNKFSTLRSPGVPKIAWEKDGLTESDIMKAQKLGSLLVDKKHVIPYMFSIENLAWKDSPHYRKLPACEKGPFGGRLMWFPPYNISFTDNTSINWDTTSFIGRAEPIYTYNNTERTGTLSFSIVVDHPSIINKLKEDAFQTTTINDKGEKETISSSTNLETFFAGCDANTTKNIIREAYKEIIPAEETIIKEPEEVETKEVVIDILEQKDGLSFYFKNATDPTYKEPTGKYPSYPNIIKASSCSESDKFASLKISNILGRCFDYNYEVEELEWYDNPKLYKTGQSTVAGACWGATVCEGETISNGVKNIVGVLTDEDSTNLIPNGYTQEGLTEIPQGFNKTDNLVCNGSDSKFVKYGPNVNTDNKGTLWWKIGGSGYNIDFCNKCLPTTGSTNETLSCPVGYDFNSSGVCYSSSTSCQSGYTLSGGICYSASTSCPIGYTGGTGGICYSGTSTASTITTTVTGSSITTTVTASTITTSPETISANKLGFLGGRSGYNQRFFGTGNAVDPLPDGIPYDKTNTSPKLKLGVEKEWEFTVDGGPIGEVGKGINQLIEFLSTTPEGKGYKIHVIGNTSSQGNTSYNEQLGKDRALTVAAWMYSQMVKCEADHVKTENGRVLLSVEGFSGVPLYKESEKKYRPYVDSTSGNKDIRQTKRWSVSSKGESEASDVGDNSNVGGKGGTGSAKSGEFVQTPSRLHPGDTENTCQLQSRRVDIKLVKNEELIKEYLDLFQKASDANIQGINEAQQVEFEAKKAKAKADAEAEKAAAINLAKNFINECDYFMKIKEEDSFLYDSIKDKLRNFHPAFHSITPEGFNSRITFLQQCGRQGPSFIDPNQPQNTAFGRPPVCILRIGDFYFTKIIIDTINFTFDPLQWDLNPEGIGVQPMLCNIDLNFKFIGGSTLQGPLSALQNAVSYNFFANTALYMPLEKILEKRKTFKLTGTDTIDGNVGVEETGEIEVDTRYFYGPFAGQSEFDNAIGLGKEDEPTNTTPSGDENDETNESEDAASQGEGGNDGEEPGTNTSDFGCQDETQLSKEEMEFFIGQPDMPEEVQKDVTKWNGYSCFDPPPSILYGTFRWVRKVDDINKTEEEKFLDPNDPLTEETGQQNTTTDEGGLLFAETSSLGYDQGATYSNEYGAITISGDYVDADEGTGNFLSPITDPTNGCLPNFVYGRIHPDIANDYYVSITNDTYYESLDGSSGNRGGGNLATIWNNTNPPVKETENSVFVVDADNRPSQQVGKQIFAFNILDYAINFNQFDLLKSASEVEEDGFFVSDELIGNMQSEIDKNGIAKWKVSFYIQMDETDESLNTRVANGATGDDAFRNVHGGSIRIVGEINQLGLDAIKAAVGIQ